LGITYLGELAALGTAICWSFSSLFFTVAGRRLGSLATNRFRLLAAVLLVSITHVLLYGRPFPIDAGSDRWLWLGLSAIIGLVIGDSLLFQGYVLIGTRIPMLLMSLAPIFGALLAWLLLGETLSFVEIAAISVALGGVAWVVAEQNGTTRVTVTRRQYVLGILCGLGGALGQALGLVTAKRGLAGDFNALSAVVIRMTVAMLVMWLWTVLRGQLVPTLRAMRDGRAVAAVMGGATAGPFLGVWLSLIAVQSSRVGIASTLMAMSPVLVLPLVRLVFHENVSGRAAAGTLVAMSGVALMFLH
jgi:drug/metabolite transporter (DMT)-like permease